MDVVPNKATRSRLNPWAVVSLVLALFVWALGISSVAAIVAGTIAQRQIDQSNGTQRGRGLATAGIVLGWAGVMVMLAMLGILLTVFRNGF